MDVPVPPVDVAVQMTQEKCQDVDQETVVMLVMYLSKLSKSCICVERTDQGVSLKVEFSAESCEDDHTDAIEDENKNSIWFRVINTDGEIDVIPGEEEKEEITE
jgi:hypothetical protein